MKKYLLLFAVLLIGSSSFYAKAQESKLELYNSMGEIVESGSYHYIVDSKSSRAMITDTIFIKNVTDDAVKIKVRKIENVIESPANSKFWALNQEVVDPKTITPVFLELEAGAITPDTAYFLGSYSPRSVLGTASIMYSFLVVDGNNQVLDSVYFTYAFSTTSITPLNEFDGALYEREVLVYCDANEVKEYTIDIYNHTEGNLNYRIQQIISEQIEGLDYFFNYGGEEYTEGASSSFTINAGETLDGENGLIAKFNPNGTDLTGFLPSVKYRLFNAVNGNENDYVTLIYAISGVGFGELNGYSVSAPYPNPAKNYFAVDYDLQKSNNATLNVYQNNGALLAKYDLQNNKGTAIISTVDFSVGIYYYTIQIDGKTIGAEKVIIQK